MRITELHAYSHQLPVKNGPYTMANAKVWSLDTTLVKLVTDTGLIGWGETCPVGPTYAPSHALGARAALMEMGQGADRRQPVAAHDAPPPHERPAQRPPLCQGGRRHGGL